MAWRFASIHAASSFGTLAFKGASAMKPSFMPPHTGCAFQVPAITTFATRV